jgi:predicted nucleic acid-binding protein
MKKIADTGFIVALLSQDDQYADWARAEAQGNEPPWYTCEGAVVEAGYLTGRPAAVLGLVREGILVIDFALRDHASEIARLCQAYEGRMDMVDGCVVRMTELYRNCRVWTVDKTDFTIYRRLRDQPIPCEFPR